MISFVRYIISHNSQILSKEKICVPCYPTFPYTYRNARDKINKLSILFQYYSIFNIISILNKNEITIIIRGSITQNYFIFESYGTLEDLVSIGTFFLKNQISTRYHTYQITLTFFEFLISCY